MHLVIEKKWNRSVNIIYFTSENVKNNNNNMSLLFDRNRNRNK